MNYYVYLHLKEDTKEPFYVGKGKGQRALFKNGRSEFWQNVVKKHGYLIKIIMSELSEEQALSLEQVTIANLKEIGVKLCNLTNGGDGVSGMKHSDASKMKMSLAKKGKPSPLKGIPKTAEHIEKIASKKRGIPTGPFSEERKENISKAKKGKQLTQITCPHCNKTMSKALETRYKHIGNCK